MTRRLAALIILPTYCTSKCVRYASAMRGILAASCGGAVRRECAGVARGRGGVSAGRVRARAHAGLPPHGLRGRAQPCARAGRRGARLACARAGRHPHASATDGTQPRARRGRAGLTGGRARRAHVRVGRCGDERARERVRHARAPDSRGHWKRSLPLAASGASSTNHLSKRPAPPPPTPRTAPAARR
jgi:hypothetical protein